MEELTNQTFIGEAVGTGMVLVDMDPAKRDAVLVPEGYNVEDLERFHAQPRRTRQQVAIHNATDFGLYVLQ